MSEEIKTYKKCANIRSGFAITQGACYLAIKEMRDKCPDDCPYK